jgi:hypothetical protein
MFIQISQKVKTFFRALRSCYSTLIALNNKKVKMVLQKIEMFLFERLNISVISAQTRSIGQNNGNANSRNNITFFWNDVKMSYLRLEDDLAHTEASSLLINHYE